MRPTIDGELALPQLWDEAPTLPLLRLLLGARQLLLGRAGCLAQAQLLDHLLRGVLPRTLQTKELL